MKNGKICEAFEEFDIGATRELIWYWFQETHGLIIAELLFPEESQKLILRHDAPKGVVNIRDRIEQFALENGYVINQFVDKKIQWMETHKGLCFCNWELRGECPCSKCSDDMIQFNGRCFCSLFFKPKVYELYAKNKQKRKAFTAAIQQ